MPQFDVTAAGSALAAMVPLAFVFYRAVRKEVKSETAPILKEIKEMRLSAQRALVHCQRLNGYGERHQDQYIIVESMAAIEALQIK